MSSSAGRFHHTNTNTNTHTNNNNSNNNNNNSDYDEGEIAEEDERDIVVGITTERITNIKAVPATTILNIAVTEGGEAAMTTTTSSSKTNTTTTNTPTATNNRSSDGYIRRDSTLGNGGNSSSISSRSNNYAMMNHTTGSYTALVSSAATTTTTPTDSMTNTTTTTTTTASSNATATGVVQPPPPPPPPRGVAYNNNNNNNENHSAASQPLLQQHQRNLSTMSNPTMERGQQQQPPYPPPPPPLLSSLPRGNGIGGGGGGGSLSSTTTATTPIVDMHGSAGGPAGSWQASRNGTIGSTSSSNISHSSTTHRSTYDTQPPGGGTGGWQPRGGGGGRGMYRGGGGGGRGGGVGSSIQRHNSYSAGPSMSASTTTSTSSLFGTLPPKNSINMRSQSYSATSTNPIPNHRGAGPPPPPQSSSSSSSSQQQRPTDPRFRGTQLASSAGMYHSHDAQISSTLSSSLGNTAPSHNYNNDHYASSLRPIDSHTNTYRGTGLSQQRHAAVPPPSSSLEGMSSTINSSNSFSALAEPDMTSFRRSSGNSIAAASGLDGSDNSGSTIGTYSSIALQRGGGSIRRGSSEVLEVPIITSADSNYHRPSIRDNGPFRSNSFRTTSVGEAGPYNRNVSIGGGPPNTRGGLGGPSLSTDSAETPFRGPGSDYYGPKGFPNGAAEFPPPRHSPTQRGGGGGRPGFRVGVSGLSSQPIGREASLPPPPPVQQQQQQHRRSDPRFAAMATKTDSLYVSDSLQYSSIDHQRMQQNDGTSNDDISRASSIGGFERGRYSHDGQVPFRRNSGMTTQQHQQINRMASDIADDPFGRTNQWKSSNRPSPLSTPEDRKPSHNYFPTSPGSYLMQPPPPPPPNLSSTTSRELSIESSKILTGVHNQSALAASSNEAPVEKSIDTHPPPSALLTSALGDENTDRAEKAVAEVEFVLQLATVNTGYLRELPSKQQILQSLNKLDAQIKKRQKDIAVTKREIEQAKVEEEELRQKAVTEAIIEAQREVERKLEEEKERKLSEEQAHSTEVNSYVEERTLLYGEEQATHLAELEAKIKAVKDEEEKKMREALNEQMITTADNFDRDIVQMKKDLEKATTATKKHETRLSNAERSYREKVAQSGNQEPVDLQTKPVDLVSQILAENRRRAAEAHLLQPMFVSQDEESVSDHSYDDLALVTDPLHGKTTAEWSQMARKVTGPADALYSEPCKAPYYAHNEQMFELMAPLIQEHVRHKQNKLKKRWMELAEEYEYRQNEYKKELRKTENSDKPKKAHAVPIRHSILQGGKPNQPIVESGGRTSNNPYRRARRGNEVRSEYEQEQIIAEIAAKEAMEKRITFGGSDLPRQICKLERELTCPYINSFNAQRVDLLEQENELALCNVWTDMEKSIFLDRWLQFPKDFKKIASFLRNKTTKDCIQFYYDSKQSVPYKGALREHVMRRKRRGDYNIWTLTIEAALSVGSVVEAGSSEEKPVVFLLPERDDTYNTRLFHPMKREVYDAMVVDELAAADYDDGFDENSKTEKSRKRPRQPLFTLDREQSKFLKEVTPPQSIKSANPSQTILEASDGNMTDDGTKDGTGSQTPMRKVPQKWTNSEKRIFLETLEKHGRNWAMIADAVGTKSVAQIKSYHYDYKKKSGKGRADLDAKGIRQEKESVTPPPEPYQPSEPIEQTPIADVEVRFDKVTPIKTMNSHPPATNYQVHQYQAHPIQHHGQQQQQQQQQQHLQQQHLPQYHSMGGTSGIPQSMAHLLHSAENNDRSIPHSEASTPDRLDIWAHAQRLQTEEATRHLLLQQHSQQTEQQQILSNLLPWINSGQLSQHVAASNLQEQQLQNFLQLQQLQQPQTHNHFNQLAALGLTGLSGLANAGMAGLGQQQQHHHHQSHHHHHHQPQQQQQLHPSQHHHQHGGGQQQQHHHSQHHHRQNSHDAQLVFAQHLLSMQAQQQQDNASGAAMDALGLLARTLPDSNRNNSNNNQSGAGNYHG